MSDWSSDVCSSDLGCTPSSLPALPQLPVPARPAGPLRWKRKKQKSRCRDIGQKHRVPSFARIDLHRSGGRTPSPSPPEHQGSTQSLDWRGAGAAPPTPPPPLASSFAWRGAVSPPTRGADAGCAPTYFSGDGGAFGMLWWGGM